jgi:NAD(P)-dependent dehydrogenase (short-subunit alcohol dehydrogenase family)
MTKVKTVLITGASSGLGHATASLLSSRGYRVFGTSRNPEKPDSGNFEMSQLDVRSDESATACIGWVMERAGRLDVLINNAGYEFAGALEETSIEEAKAQLETNFFGVVRMIKAVLPIMRHQRSGQIINIGSLAGLIGIPFHGFYSASKFALEGYTETLRHEVRNFNIRVSIIEPSFMKTNLGLASKSTARTLTEYAPLRTRALQYFAHSLESGDDPAKIAATIQSIIESSSPKLQYRVGKMAKRIARLKMLMPQGVFESGTRRTFNLDVKA